MRVEQYSPDFHQLLPVSGAGTALVDGALLKIGVTASTDNGHLILASGTSAQVKPFAILRGAHPVANDTDVAGTVWKPDQCDLIVPVRLLRCRFSQAAGDLISGTQATATTTTFTLTSLENNIQGGWIYCVSGKGSGQLQYIASQGGVGSCVFKSIPAVPFDATSRFIKIIPRFNQLISLTSDGTALSSQAAAGSGTAIIVDLHIQRNGITDDQLDPTKHDALTKLDKNTFNIEATVAFKDTLPYGLT